MATALIDDAVDLMACGVCFHRYDLENRKPKFLTCSHSLCLSCIQEILKQNIIRCPFCRVSFYSPNADSLPNNNYAIQILRLMEKSKKTSPETDPKKLTSMSWCPVCQAGERSLCRVLGHSTISMTSDTVKNMEQMIQARTELVKLKDQGKDTIVQIVQKRRLIEEHLSLVMKSIRWVEEEVQKLQDDNDLKLTKVLSILESNMQQVSANTSEVNEKEEEDDSLTAELMSMIEDFDPEDTVETLVLKMKKALDIYTEYLEEVTSTTSHYDFLEKTKITVQNTEKVSPTLTLNLVKKNRTEQDVILLSYAILSLLERKNLLPTTLESVTNTAVIDNGAPNSVLHNSAIEDVNGAIVNNTISFNSFVLGQSVFILKIRDLAFISDEIWIQPCITFNNDFVQNLGSYCYKSPKILTSIHKKPFQAVKDVYVQFSGAHTGASVAQQNNPFATKALEVDEVGLQIVKTPKAKSGVLGFDSEIEWKMIFPLINFKNSMVYVHTVDCKAELFGKVIKKNPQTLTKLSSTSIAERHRVIVTLESV